MNQKDRLETILTTLPEPEAAKIRWLLKYTTLRERPWPWERMEALREVLPEEQMAELQSLYDHNDDDTAKEKIIFWYIGERYSSDNAGDTFFAVYGAANCMPMQEFKMNYQTAMAGAG